MSRPISTALILAAGRGTRLGSAGQLAPKGFLRLGHRPIIEESIHLLRKAGMAHILLVTGHLHGFYDDLAGRLGPDVQTVFNPRYAESGSMYSLCTAGEALGQEDFLLLESDLIYEKRALQEALGSNSPNRLLVSGPTLSGDEVYVEAEGTQLRQLSKNRAILGGKVVGELVGITRISAPLHQAMREAASKYFSLNPYLEYEQALVMASARHIVECHLVQDLIWSEIDDEQHLARAREEVYPRILARDGGLRG